MKLTDKQIELLEKEYFGTLTPEEEAELKQHYKSLTFTQTADEYKEIFSKVEQSVEVELRENMRLWDKRSYGKRMVNNSWMKIAASFFLIAVIGSLLLWMQRGNPSDISGYYETYPNVVTFRGETGRNTVTKGMQLYDEKNYAETIRVLEAVEGTDAAFYTAQSYFGLSKYEEASEGFSQLAGQEGKYQQVAQWYKALCEFKLNKSNGLELMKNIAKSKSTYADEAEDFLRQK